MHDHASRVRAGQGVTCRRDGDTEVLTERLRTDPTPGVAVTAGSQVVSIVDRSGVHFDPDDCSDTVEV